MPAETRIDPRLWSVLDWAASCPMDHSPLPEIVMHADLDDAENAGLIEYVWAASNTHPDGDLEVKNGYFKLTTAGKAAWQAGKEQHGN